MRCYSQRGTRCQTSTGSPSGDASSKSQKELSAATKSRAAEEAETPSHSAPSMEEEAVSHSEPPAEAVKTHSAPERETGRAEAETATAVAERAKQEEARTATSRKAAVATATVVVAKGGWPEVDITVDWAGAVRVRAAAERAEVVAGEGEHPVVGA